MVNDILFVIGVLFTVYLIIQPRKGFKVLGFIMLGIAALVFKHNFMPNKRRLANYDPNRPSAWDLEEARVERINKSHEKMTGKKLIT